MKKRFICSRIPILDGMHVGEFLHSVTKLTALYHETFLSLMVQFSMGNVDKNVFVHMASMFGVCAGNLDLFTVHRTRFATATHFGSQSILREGVRPLVVRSTQMGDPRNNSTHVGVHLNNLNCNMLLNKISGQGHSYQSISFLWLSVKI